jgi:Fur family ferric uptake transcriptional regulator
MAILHILEEAQDHLTPVEVYRLASQRIPGLTEATVYRTLEFLARQGLALASQVGSGRLAYEGAGRNHHHLVCRACGHTIEVAYSELENIYRQFRERIGFQVDPSPVTFFGLCTACSGTG